MRVKGFVLSVIVSVLFSTEWSTAHQASSGWQYPFYCCSNFDCREIPQELVDETSQGYSLPNGELLLYNDARVKQSPDGKYHWCVSKITRCLFIPPKSS